jgi:hypothetical protein
MCHKAYAFDWDRFAVELQPVIERALAKRDSRLLVEFMLTNRDNCSDPYEGGVLPLDWESLLETGNVQELADFALTKYYDPLADFGLQEHWLHVEAQFPESVRSALLGLPIGSPEAPFDPGAMGAYFQTPSMVLKSLATLESYGHEELRDYVGLLRGIAQSGLGLYVSF